MSNGYEALRSGAGLIDLSSRGKIKATGEDRVRLLHAMATNHVEQLEPGHGCYAFFLNAQGRILADANILAFDDHLLLDTEPETRKKVRAHLDHYIIADDVTLEDITDSLATVAVEGPQAKDAITAAGAPVPEEELSLQPWGNRWVLRASATGAEGSWILAPAAEKDTVIEQMLAAGAVRASSTEARIVRIENGRPRYGDDLGEDHIPHETQLLRAVHFNKGCYLGQEIVERVRSRGNVNKLLVRLEAAGAAPPPTGTQLTAGDNPAGTITSAVHSPALGKIVALGYVRAAFAKPDQPLSADGMELQVTALKPN